MNKYKEENNQLKIEFNERNKFINKLDSLLKEKKYNFKNVNDFLRIFEETNNLNEDNKRLFINKTFYIKKIIDIYYPKTNHVDQLKSKIDGMPKTNFNFEKIVFNEYLEKALKLLEESNIKYKDLFNEFIELKNKIEMDKYFNKEKNADDYEEKNIEKNNDNFNSNKNCGDFDDKKFYTKTKSKIINSVMENYRIFDHGKVKFSDLKINENKENKNNNTKSYTDFKLFNNPFYSGDTTKNEKISENVNVNTNKY